MWKFVQGVQKPTQKRKTEGDKLEKDREYDASKRKRSFFPQWKETYLWVYCVRNTEGDNEMFCRTCIDNPQTSDSKSSFVTGCSNFRLEAIREYSKTRKHISASEVVAAKSAPVGTTPAEKMLHSMNETHFSRLKRLFLTSHALIKKGRPFTDFTWLCKLDKLKDVDIGETYQNDKACRTFGWYIAETERQNIETKVKCNHFYSLLSDGLTDSSITEVEIVYIRHANKGEVKTDLLGLAGVEKADAIGITNAILQQSCEQLKLDQNELLSKLVGFGSDGASVMVGCKNGVSTKLKEKQMEVLSSTEPILQSVHCFNHRLELGYKDLLTKVPYHDKVETLLVELYKFYHYSPLNRSMLKRSCVALGIPFYAPSRVGGTRWLPHTRKALENLWVTYPAIVEHCRQLQATGDVKEDSKAKAKGFLELLSTPRFVLYGHFLTDVVLVLSKLSLKFQGSDWFSAGDIKHELNISSTKLDSFKTTAGPYLRKVYDLTHDDHPTFKGHNLTIQGRLRGQDATAVGFENDRVKLLDGLATSLNNRFADTDAGVIKSLSFAQIKTWPEHETPDYRNDDVALLIDHFRPILVHAGVHPEEAEDEWITLRGNIFSSTTFGQRQNFLTRPSWRYLNVMYGEECPNILALVDLALSIPASSAECERGFSQMKIIKSDWRSRLSQSAVRDIMRVVLQTPAIGEYDPTEAVALWLKGGIRSKRPYIRPYGRRRPKTLAVEPNVTVSSSSSSSEEAESSSDLD